MIPDNTKVQIVRVSDNYDFLQYFGSLNLEIDDTIEVLKHEKFDNSLVVKKEDGTKLTIGAKAIDYIFVELR
ncbi:FeoA family protein [Companilactobacillus alimentarius]